MILPRVTGTLHKARNGHAVVTVRCPECGGTHRHDLGMFDDPDVSATLARRSVDAWMACRADLPGNFYRIVLPPPHKAKSGGDEPKASATPATAQEATARPRKRRRRRRRKPSDEHQEPAAPLGAAAG
ncbi:MAG TPA: hypothetical protein VFL82_06430 [Thermomicrobiales bacterium]|nr:hypothetical protein [Thermomicrobiales bacterium]